MTDGMTDRFLIVLNVNGIEHELLVPARRTLVDALRHDLGLTGTHVGCEHGVCGACTVLVDGLPARSCLLLAVQAEGKDLRTVEGLAEGDALNPLQQAFRTHHALQCGFCTPGMLMLAEGVLTLAEKQGTRLDRERVREEMSANLCRCTGYEPIVDAVTACAQQRGLVGEER